MAVQKDILKAPPPNLTGPQAIVYNLIDSNGLSMAPKSIIKEALAKTELTKQQVLGAISSGLHVRRFIRRPNGHIKIASWEEWCKRCDERGVDYDGRSPLRAAAEKVLERHRTGTFDAPEEDLSGDVAQLQENFGTMMDLFHRAVKTEDSDRQFKVQSFTAGALFGGLCAIGGFLIALLVR